MFIQCRTALDSCFRETTAEFSTVCVEYREEGMRQGTRKNAWRNTLHLKSSYTRRALISMLGLERERKKHVYHLRHKVCAEDFVSGIWGILTSKGKNIRKCHPLNSLWEETGECDSRLPRCCWKVGASPCFCARANWLVKLEGKVNSWPSHPRKWYG